MYLTPEQIKEAREWIADCIWQNLDLDAVDELPDERVELGVKYHYAGGIAQFIQDGGYGNIIWSME